MSIFNFLRILWVRRNLILVTVFAALLAAIVVIKIIPARYTASSRLMLDIVKPDPITGQALSSTFARAYVATQIELIKDYRVAGRVVDSFGWTGSPELGAQYQASGEGPGVSFRRWLAQKIIVNTDVALIPGSNILEITYTSDEPGTAARVADALRDAYEFETRSQRQRSAQESADWFTGQIKKLQSDLVAAQKTKADFERENGIVINDDLSDVDSERLRALASAQDMPAMPTMGGGGVPIMAPSQGQLQQIDAAIEIAMRTLGPNHPRLVALRQQRSVVAASVQQELAAARAAAAPATVNTGPSAASRFASQQSRVLSQRGKVGEAQELAIRVNTLREQLQLTSKRAAELQQEADSPETGLDYLGSAIAPASPSFPKIPLIVMGALGLGLSLGVGLSILIEMLFRKVRGPGDLKIFDVPVLGMARVPAVGVKKPSLFDRGRVLLPMRLRPSK